MVTDMNDNAEILAPADYFKMPGAPTITLKNLTYNERLSEETLAFAATVIFDEQKIAASNRGTGGCNMYHADQSLVARATEFAKSVLNDSFEPLDSLISEQIERMQLLKKLRRACKTNICFIKPGDNIRTTYRTIKIADTPGNRTSILTEYPGSTILNDIVTAAR